MIVVLMDRKLGTHQVPSEFQDYLLGADDIYSPSRQLKKPILIGTELLQYSVTHNGSTLGRSRIEYLHAGHTYNHILHPWDSYYTRLRLAVDDVIRTNDITLQAVIFTTNYLNRNRPGFMTVDLVVEFLPSGLLSAVAHIASSTAYSNRLLETSTLRIFIGVIGVIICMFTIYVLCKPIDYFEKWITCRLWVFFISCFVAAEFLAFRRHKKYTLLNKMSLKYNSNFIDIHEIYAIDLVDQCLLSTIIFVVILELASEVYRLVGSGRNTGIATCSFRLVFAVFAIGLYMITLFELAHYHSEPRHHPIAVLAFMKQLLPIDPENDIYLLRDSLALISFLLIYVQALVKFCTAIPLCCSLSKGMYNPSVIKYIIFHGVLRRKGGGMNIDKEGKSIQLLSSNIDRKMFWLVN